MVPRQVLPCSVRSSTRPVGPIVRARTPVSGRMSDARVAESGCISAMFGESEASVVGRVDRRRS